MLFRFVFCTCIAIKLIFAARLDSPVPLMNTLHWLPIKQERMNFKICMYVFKCRPIHRNASNYSTDFISHWLDLFQDLSQDHQWLLLHMLDAVVLATNPISLHLDCGMPSLIQEAKSPTVFKKMLKSHLYPNYWLLLCLVFAFVYHWMEKRVKYFYCIVLFVLFVYLSLIFLSYYRCHFYRRGKTCSWSINSYLYRYKFNAFSF